MYEKPNVFGFSMLFDKYEYWATETQAERNEFLLGLLEYCQELFQCLPHTSIDLKKLRSLEEEEKVMSAIDDITHSYRELLNPDEEKELEELLNSYIGDDEKTHLDQLVNTLTQQLTKLEEDNIQEMMESEALVNGLLFALDASNLQLQQLNQWLNNYSSLLANMNTDIEKINARNDYLEVARSNYSQIVALLQANLKS
eukprot:TRINITY_DN3248_c0_g1_i3.p1 TRINITY_DN3248_c0_g1~~TRINITY_DN3248_c0_g1_i3.p1  ORF type:complete len:199 (+),score=61.59 TRINITY_DN3248_c0_g1_i3:668-1264(+)